MNVLKNENMILHKIMIYVKVIKNDMRDLEFSSSGRRGNGGPKAPERMLCAKVIYSILAPESANFGQK